jgi:hypothetical protein
MEDLDFVTRLERSGQTANEAEPVRKPIVRCRPITRSSGPRRSWADRSSRRVSRRVAGRPPIGVVGWPFKAPPLTAKSGGRDQGRSVGDERAHCGTGSSNPLPSSGESTNFRFLLMRACSPRQMGSRCGRPSAPPGKNRHRPAMRRIGCVAERIARDASQGSRGHLPGDGSRKRHVPRYGIIEVLLIKKRRPKAPPYLY